VALPDAAAALSGPQESCDAGSSPDYVLSKEPGVPVAVVEAKDNSLRVTDCSEKPSHLTTGLLRSAMSLFDPFQEFLIILLFDPVGLFRAPTEPANILGNLLHQSNHVGLIF
jgi:hypothetical protein